jgi:hypothetical protein
MPKNNLILKPLDHDPFANGELKWQLVGKLWQGTQVSIPFFTYFEALEALERYNQLASEAEEGTPNA